MRAIHLAYTELRRITASRMARISVLALVLVPTIYAGLYLYANHDPYGRLDQVPAALVVADRGATDPDGGELQAGRDVADQLLESGDFDWHEVTLEEAEHGVRTGRFDFALVIPRDFSASLTSTATTDPEQARLRLVTNDANSYLSTTIANTVVTKVREAVAEQVSERAAETLLLGLSDVRRGLLDGADGAAQLHDGLVTAHEGAGRLADGADALVDGAGTLQDGAGELADGLGTLAEKTAPLPRQTQRLADGADRVADGNEQLADAGRRATEVVHEVRDRYRDERANLVDQLKQQGVSGEDRAKILGIYDRVGEPIERADREASELQDSLDELATGARRVADGNAALAAATPALVEGIGDAEDGASRIETGAGRLARGAGELSDGASDLHDGLGRLVRGSDKLADALASGADRLPATDEDARARMAEMIGNPVDIASASQASAGSYGAGLAPFFLALSTWIGGYVLFLVVRPLSRRAIAANAGPLRIALGGWLAPAILGLAQMTLAVGVVAFGVGIRPLDLPLTWALLLLTSVTFVAVIHTFVALLGTPGMFVSLVVMVLQLVTAGGTFPWQTIPAPLYVVHHVLPMAHAVDGLRQVMYGGTSARLWSDVVVLLLWLVGALAISAWVAWRRRVWTPRQVAPAFEI